jgi:transcriptional regulator with XRE-family HTH domain
VVVTTLLEPERLAQPTSAFAGELRHWRELRGLSQKRLAAAMGYDPSYISKIEGGQQRPSSALARRADEILEAGGAIERRWRADEARRRGAGRNGGHRPTPNGRRETDTGPAPPLVVEHDHAELRYESGLYAITVRRLLRNAGEAPITRFPIRIAVDRFPDDQERSNRLYRTQPLSLPELALEARCEGKRMSWRVQHDWDACKELWLLFENPCNRFPLYPGETVRIEYGYQVSDEQWGQWFQRAVRLPTRRLSVKLRFPVALQAAVWGLETSMTADALPLRTAIAQRDVGNARVCDWATEDPPLHARFRFEWQIQVDEHGDRVGQVLSLEPKTGGRLAQTTALTGDRTRAGGKAAGGRGCP